MPTKRYSTEQIVSKLRQVEVELSRGLRVPLVCKQLGISEQTYYRWPRRFGVTEVARELQQKNALAGEATEDSRPVTVENRRALPKTSADLRAT